MRQIPSLHRNEMTVTFFVDLLCPTAPSQILLMGLTVTARLQNWSILETNML
jgi:hypothetical protein